MVHDSWNKFIIIAIIIISYMMFESFLFSFLLFYYCLWFQNMIATRKEDNHCNLRLCSYKHFCFRMNGCIGVQRCSQTSYPIIELIIKHFIGLYFHPSHKNHYLNVNTLQSASIHERIDAYVKHKSFNWYKFGQLLWGHNFGLPNLKY